jgi:hypothetical protein
MRKLSLVLILVACGDDSSRHTPDATIHDGAIDSAPDAAGTPVTLTVTRNGSGLASVPVYFQNADSSVVLATTTDASGTASAVIAAGGYVTAINPFTQPQLGKGADELDTFSAVKPGDHLVLRDNFNVGGSISVSMQAPFDPTMTSFLAYTPCAPYAQTLTPPPQSVHAAVAQAVTGTVYLDSCGSASSTDFIIYATNATQAEYIYAQNVAVADMGTVDLTASTYTPATTRTYTYTNGPANQSINLDQALADPLGMIFEINGSTPTTPQTTTLDLPLFAGATDVLQSSYPEGFSQQTLVDWGMLGSAFTTDAGARQLYAFTGPPSYDVTSHTATVPTDSGSGVAPQFAVASVRAQRTSDLKVWRWAVAAPYSSAGVVLPVLPTTIYDYNIGSADTVGIDGYGVGNVPGGYDAVRPYVLSINGPGDFASGGSGQAVLETSENFSTVQRWVPAPRTRPAVLRHRTR